MGSFAPVWLGPRLSITISTVWPASSSRWTSEKSRLWKWDLHRICGDQHQATVAEFRRHKTHLLLLRFLRTLQMYGAFTMDMLAAFVFRAVFEDASDGREGVCVPGHVATRPECEAQAHDDRESGDHEWRRHLRRSWWRQPQEEDHGAGDRRGTHQQARRCSNHRTERKSSLTLRATEPQRHRVLWFSL